MGSHQNFRRISQNLVERAEAHADPIILEAVYRRWIAAMRSHEYYEERKLYPFLARRWGVSFAEAQRGHEELHEAHADVLHAFDVVRTTRVQAMETPGSETQIFEALVAALRRHDHVLRDHLQHEEDIVIPLLLALPPVEFDIYCRSSITELLQILDSQDTLRGN